MIVTVQRSCDPKLVERELIALGLWTTRLEGDGVVQFAIGAASRAVEPGRLRSIQGVESVTAPRSAHPRVDASPRAFDIRGVAVGVGAPPVVMAGPCSVESEAQIFGLAERLRGLGVQFLRGGAYKPRTSPYAFQGHGPDALAWMRAAADRHDLAMVTEVMAPEDAGRVAELADVLQIGSRNMQNTPLLRAVAKAGRPILLKRGMASTVEEWLASGEALLLHGAPFVLYCERGIRGFDPSTRNLLDLGAVALLSEVHRLPVIVDPSHATGRRDLIPRLARAGLAAGAVGLMIETHESPGTALSDGPQALSLRELESTLEVLNG